MATILCQLAFSVALPYDTSSLRIHIDLIPGCTSSPRSSERYAVTSISLFMHLLSPISQLLPPTCTL